MFALVDCNNFYASCEEVFNPKLRNKPIVVLSNNDGCVIARSKTAKQLNIKMGDPIFKYKNLIQQKKLYIFSSNFSLYGDMSNRVFETLKTFGFEMEIYSIDEAFLLLDKIADFNKLAIDIAKTVKKWTGIPVSVGIGRTKTLAKIANETAKKNSLYALVLNEEKKIDLLLSKMQVDEIWQIGAKLAKKLNNENIFTALDLKNANETYLHKKLSVNVAKTILELRGKSVLTTQNTLRKSILFSRSFKKAIAKKDLLEKKLSSFTAKAAEKLRKQNMHAGYICVFICTNKFLEKVYFNSSNIALLEPTSYTPDLIKYAKQAFNQIYQKQYEYKKMGVLFFNLIDNSSYQKDLFALCNDEKKEKAMKILDTINKKFEKEKIYFAAQEKNVLSLPSLNKSSRYTTSFEELLKIF